MANHQDESKCSTWNKIHLWVAALLALLLLLMRFLGGYGPGGAKCCAPSAASAVAPVAATTAAAVLAPEVPTAGVDVAVPNTTIEVKSAPEPAVLSDQPVATTAIPSANVYFDVDKIAPKQVDTQLADVVKYLKANSSATVGITGFHDPRGGVWHNKALAKNRSIAVARYLQKVGISASRMKVQTPSETAGTGSLDEARRVEVRVIHP